MRACWQRQTPSTILTAAEANWQLIQLCCCCCLKQISLQLTTERKLFHFYTTHLCVSSLFVSFPYISPRRWTKMQGKKCKWGKDEYNSRAMKCTLCILHYFPMSVCFPVCNCSHCSQCYVYVCSLLTGLITPQSTHHLQYKTPGPPNTHHQNVQLPWSYLGPSVIGLLLFQQHCYINDLLHQLVRGLVFLLHLCHNSENRFLKSNFAFMQKVSTLDSNHVVTIYLWWMKTVTTQLAMHKRYDRMVWTCYQKI